jgi:hypothetical protein
MIDFRYNHINTSEIFPMRYCIILYPGIIKNWRYTYFAIKRCPTLLPSVQKILRRKLNLSQM